MLSSYSKYALNINMRQLNIVPETYDRVVAGLANKVKGNLKDLYTEILESQYKDYTENLGKPKAVVQGRRKLRLAGLIGDRHGMLVSSGCCITEFKTIYTIDYLESLDMLFALAFNMTLENARKGLDKVLEGKETSREYLALILLNNICNTNKTTDVTIGDLNKIEEVREFLLVQIRNEINNGQPVLSNLEGINYLDYIEIDNNPTTALSVAIMIKLLKAVDRLNRKLVIQHYTKPRGGIILSQDYSSISFASDSEMPDFVITHKGEDITLKMRKHRRQ